MSDGLDFELDLDAKMEGLADSVTQLDQLERQFRTSHDELDALEKSFAGTDKSLEKLASQLADTRIAMQRAMQEGDEKKFWKLAQTTDDLTKKEEALRKKSGELKSSIESQQKVVHGHADALSSATAAEKKLTSAGEARDKRTGAATSLLDRYGGKLWDTVKSTMSAADEVGGLSEGLGMMGSVAVGAVAGIALVAVAVVAVGAAFADAAWQVGKYAVEQANAKRNTEQTLRALTQNNAAASDAASAFEDIGHDTGASSDQLLTYSRGLTETRRQMGLAAASSKDMQTVMRAAATASSALDDQSAGQSIIDKFNSGLATADQLADQVDKKYGDVVKQKMLGLDQQMSTLDHNLSGLTEHFDVKPVLEGLQRMVDLTDKNTASGKFLQDAFDTVFGPSTGTLVETFFVGLERYFLQTEIAILDIEIGFYEFRNAVNKALDIDLGPFGNLKDDLNALGDAEKTCAVHMLSFLNPITAIREVMNDISAVIDKLSPKIKDLGSSMAHGGFDTIGQNITAGLIGGVDKGGSSFLGSVKRSRGFRRRHDDERARDSFAVEALRGHRRADPRGPRARHRRRRAHHRAIDQPARATAAASASESAAARIGERLERRRRARHRQRDDQRILIAVQKT